MYKNKNKFVFLSLIRRVDHASAYKLNSSLRRLRRDIYSIK